MILKFLVSSSLLVAGSLFYAVSAEEASLAACIQKYRTIGISPDVALSQCKEETIGSCVKNMVGRNFVAVKIKENNGKFLMDLGNDRTRWLEGGQWRKLGCDAYSKGPYHRQSDMNQNTLGWVPGFKGRSFEWFRQGWCRGSVIELQQPYSLEEATLACKMGVTPPPKNDFLSSPADVEVDVDIEVVDPFD